MRHATCGEHKVSAESRASLAQLHRIQSRWAKTCPKKPQRLERKTGSGGNGGRQRSGPGGKGKRPNAEAARSRPTSPHLCKSSRKHWASQQPHLFLPACLQDPARQQPGWGGNPLVSYEANLDGHGQQWTENATRME